MKDRLRKTLQVLIAGIKMKKNCSSEKCRISDVQSIGRLHVSKRDELDLNEEA